MAINYSSPMAHARAAARHHRAGRAHREHFVGRGTARSTDGGGYAANKAALAAFSEAWPSTCAIPRRRAPSQPGYDRHDLFHLPDNEEGFHSEVERCPSTRSSSRSWRCSTAGASRATCPRGSTTSSRTSSRTPTCSSPARRPTPPRPRPSAREKKRQRMNRALLDRSGCSRMILVYIGWKLKQPARCEPICFAVSSRHVVVDQDRLPAASASSWAWHERSIVMNHHAASSTECPTVSSPWLRRMTALPRRALGDALALLEVEDDARVVVEQRVVLVERAHVLGDRIEQPPERRPRLAVDRVRVGRRDDVGARGMDLAVDRERGPFPRAPLDDVALVVDEDQVGDPDVREVHAERVDPEVVEPLRVAGGDVPGDAFVEAELPNRRNAAASRSLRWRRSSSTVSNCGR